MTRGRLSLTGCAGAERGAATSCSASANAARLAHRAAGPPPRPPRARGGCRRSRRRRPAPAAAAACSGAAMPNPSATGTVRAGLGARDDGLERVGERRALARRAGHRDGVEEARARARRSRARRSSVLVGATERHEREPGRVAGGERRRRLLERQVGHDQAAGAGVHGVRGEALERRAPARGSRSVISTTGSRAASASHCASTPSTRRAGRSAAVAGGLDHRARRRSGRRTARRARRGRRRRRRRPRRSPATPPTSGKPPIRYGISAARLPRRPRTPRRSARAPATVGGALIASAAVLGGQAGHHLGEVLVAAAREADDVERRVRRARAAR